MLLRLVPSSWLRYINHAIVNEQCRRQDALYRAELSARLDALEDIDEDANIFDDASLAALAIQKRDALAPPPGQFGFGIDFSIPTPPPEVMSREELLAQTEALRSFPTRPLNTSDEVITLAEDSDEEAVYCLHCRHRPCECGQITEPCRICGQVSCVCIISENPF